MAEALGGLYDTPHGVANAILLPYVMEYNCAAATEKFVRIAEAMGADTVPGGAKDEAALAAVEAVRRLNRDLNIPSLRDAGTREEDLPELAKRASMNVSVDSNPRKVGEAEFLEIFRKALLQ
jgi:alcohol dehydrogenase class IV